MAGRGYGVGGLLAGVVVGLSLAACGGRPAGATGALRRLLSTSPVVRSYTVLDVLQIYMPPGDGDPGPLETDRTTLGYDIPTHTFAAIIAPTVVQPAVTTIIRPGTVDVLESGRWTRFIVPRSFRFPLWPPTQAVLRYVPKTAQVTHDADGSYTVSAPTTDVFAHVAPQTDRTVTTSLRVRPDGLPLTQRTVIRFTHGGKNVESRMYSDYGKALAAAPPQPSQVSKTVTVPSMAMLQRIGRQLQDPTLW